MRKISLALIMISALFTTFTAQASFDGATVQASAFFPDLSSPLGNVETAVVGPGVEFTDFPSADQRTDIDFSATNILITYKSASSWTTAEFNGDVFETLSATPPITGVTLNGATNMVGLDASRIGFTATTVWVNWNGLPFDTSTVVSLDVSFEAQAEPVAPVPTLGQFALVLLILLTGTLGMYGLRRTHN